MQLSANLNREVEGKKYYKYSIIIPPSAVEELGWDGGDELDYQINNGKLIIEKTGGD